MLVVWGCVRYLAIGGGVSLFFQRSLIDSLTIDFDPGKVQETAFKADTCLALLIATAVGKSISPDITDAERNKNFLAGNDCFLGTANQLLSFSTNHVAIDEGILSRSSAAFKGGNCDSHERIPFTGFHFTNAVEIADTSGMQVEVFGFVSRVAHGVSPVLSIQSGDTLRPGGKVFPAWVVERNFTTINA
ncbi:hypothetical protein AO286_08945 [Pseudomonas syringae]|nr:hypothetical protein AL056_28295 [Pseudomonas amygdali pv. morsprunorum]PHN71870.1 hypothetical protein AO286_08945 [Pseudomonas syringae]POC82574.1 hypothetical protein BKM08_25815 [Pseudomonas amygdali pv. morsprunorum]POR76114.1 hypothetical protein BKM25_14165 [Pseudomonas avellanae]